MSAKRILIGGNWKCNGTIAEAVKIIDHINQSGTFPVNAEVVIAVPSIHLEKAKKLFRPDVFVSAEDVGVNAGFGAYTGEISPQLLLDSGIIWTLTGHSERRVGFGIPGETSALVGKKTAVAIASGLNVIACIGEKLAERENGTTLAVCAEQLSAISAAITPEQWVKVVIAYEPVWAIGTGKVATPEQAEETHAQIRDWISTNVSPEVATAVRIIYGGSVKASNAATLISQPNIDGFLVGGASLLPEFVDIIQSAAVKL